MELATDPTEETNHTITEVMKYKYVRKIYVGKIRLTPTMEREEYYHTKEKIRRYQTKHSHTLTILTT